MTYLGGFASASQRFEVKEPVIYEFKWDSIFIFTGVGIAVLAVIWWGVRRFRKIGKKIRSVKRV